MGSVIEEVDKAIGAHSKWKVKLRMAIDTGECESTPERVKMDSNCSFGKWLHEGLDSKYKKSEHYNQVVSLHARFHKEASAILELALNADKDGANTKLGLGSKFSNYSNDLTQKMKEWQRALQLEN